MEMFGVQSLKIFRPGEESIFLLNIHLKMLLN